MWIAFAVGALLITVFIGKVSEALRRQEQEALQYQQRLAHHERLASIATLAAGAAHELGTPLATIAVASRELELSGNGLSGAANIAEDARLIRSQVERCSEILRQMGGRSAEPAGEMPTRITLKEICAQVKSELPCEQRDLVDTEVAQDVTTLLPNGGGPASALGPGQERLGIERTREARYPHGPIRTGQNSIYRSGRRMWDERRESEPHR